MAQVDFLFLGLARFVAFLCGLRNRSRVALASGACFRNVRRVSHP